ncbi:MAG: zf-TFIIB domain-containing protein [Candidatus Woesearchaeota archaeon]
MSDKIINCPRCSNLINKYTMRKIKHPTGATLDVCNYCSGMWIDGPEVKILNLGNKHEGKKWQKKKNG